MVLRCWIAFAAKCLRCPLWFSLAFMFGSLFVFPAHARALPAVPGTGPRPDVPAKPGSPPAPPITFGIGEGDSVFAGGQRFRVVYDWRGDHRFHLVPVALPRSGPSPTAPPSLCNWVNSDTLATAGTIAYFYSNCVIESSVISQSGSGTNIAVGIAGLGLGGSSITPGTGLSLELRGNEPNPGNVQARVTNANTSGQSWAYLSTQGGPSPSVVVFLKSAYNSSTSHMGLVGTNSADALGFITNEGGANTAAMWIDTSNDVGIGTASPVPGQGLTISPPASTGTPTLLSITGPAHTGLTNEANDVYFGLNRTVTFSSGSAPGEQRAVWVRAPNYGSSSGTITTAASVDISGPPGAASSLSISNSYGLNIESPALTSGVTNGYGLSVAAPKSASNNYAALFSGPVSGAVGNPSGVLPANTSTYPGTVFHMDGVTLRQSERLP